MDGTVKVGSWVEIRDGDLRESWQVVEPAEADAMRRLISSETPLARAILGQRPGDVVRVLGPERRSVTVLSVNGGIE